MRKNRRSWKNHARRKSRLSGVQALESSQFMSTAKEMFPHGTAVPQHGAELRKTVRYLPERQKLPDLLHPRFPHQPRCRPQPLRASAGRQSAMQRLCRLRTVPSKVEIVSRYCSCGLHNLSISQPVAIGKATLGKAPLTAQSAHITQNFNFAGCISNQGLHIPHHRCSWTRIENVTTGDMADREGFEPSVSLHPHTLSKRAH